MSVAGIHNSLFFISTTFMLCGAAKNSLCSDTSVRLPFFPAPTAARLPHVHSIRYTVKTDPR